MMKSTIRKDHGGKNISGDMRRLFSLFPNHPERLIAITILRAMRFPKAGSEDHKRT